ncbi:hypothetical protein KSS87_017052 [Heliosperma pusillum]|nr:hypothetical protein KSS87_017052 [Heliosperma pusillum]
MAANKVERAHELYREGHFPEALELYSIALSFANNTPQRIALHSNRAACFLKLHLFNQLILLFSSRMADNRKSLAPIPEEEEEDDDTNEDIVERNKNPEDSDWLQKAEDTSVKQVKYELKDVDENICSGPNRPLSSNSHSNGWREVEKPKGHSRLDYSRWDSVDDGSSDDDDDSDEETQPRYKFRFRTAGLKHVK